MLNYLYVALALALALYVATLPNETKDTSTPAPVAESVEGRGPEAYGCLGCIGGGILLGLRGWGAVLVAAFTEGSALVVAGCVGMCWSAIS